MKIIDWQWLAEVRVPVGDKFRLSTGVPLSRRYVLTAGHGVPTDPGAKVEIRFVADFKAEREWRSGKVVWHGNDNMDACLLEIEPFEEIQSFIYSSALPDSTTPWEGAGFPAATKITEDELKGHRESKGLAGQYLPGGGLKRGELDLNVQSPPSIPGKWAGISGAPVLCGGKLIGIVKSVKKDFDGGSLWGVSIRELLNDESLCQCLGIQDRQDLIESALAEVGRLLASAEDLAAAFGSQLNIVDPIHHIDEIVDELWQSKVQVFEEIAYQVFKSVASGDEHGLSILQQVLSLLLPMLYDQDIVNSVHSELINSTFVRLPVKTKTVAEIVMAAVGRRPASYREPIDGGRWPVGVSLIDPTPETGFSDPKQGMVAAFDQFLIEKYVDSEDRSASIDILRVLINDSLAWIAEELGGEDSHRHYLILEQKAIRDQMEHINTLRSVYPQITFVVLREDDSLLPQERRIARPLRAILAARREEAKR